MLLSLVVLMSVISVLEIKSATLQTKFRGFDHKQIEFLLVGLVLMFLISFIDYHRLLDIGPWAYGVGLVALVAVALVGTKVMGARRWINLGGGLHFQPSEWVKLILIVVIARYFWGLAGRELSWKDIGKAFALVCIPMLLVLKQPDLGTALTYFPCWWQDCFWAASSSGRSQILLLGFTVLIGGAYLSGKRLKPYQQARIEEKKNSFYQPRHRSLEAPGTRSSSR